MTDRLEQALVEIRKVAGDVREVGIKVTKFWEEEDPGWRKAAIAEIALGLSVFYGEVVMEHGLEDECPFWEFEVEMYCPKCGLDITESRYCRRHTGG
jgi:hypothetical protein